MSCKICGSGTHQALSCKASTRERFINEVRRLALTWMHSDLTGEDTYLKGKNQGVKSCGADLYALLKKHNELPGR